MRSTLRNSMIAVLVALLTVSAAACDTDGDDVTGDDQIDVVVTTTILEDTVRQLGGDDFRVHGLVNVGADPHVYQPTPNDAALVAQSDAVVMNGLTLEGWMENLVRNAGGERPVIVGGDAIDDEDLFRVEGAVDPHVWFDVELWRQVTGEVAEGLMELSDDEDVAQRVADRHDEYDQVLQQLDGWVEEQLATIADNQRVMITSHDAFNYFGEAYGIDVEAVQGMSTEQEPSQRDVANIVDLVEERRAPAVFTETSVNSRLIEQVARETGVEQRGPLHSDSVGPADSDAHTYVGMVQANVEMITDALDGDHVAFEASPAHDGDSATGDDA